MIMCAGECGYARPQILVLHFRTWIRMKSSGVGVHKFALRPAGDLTWGDDVSILTGSLGGAFMKLVREPDHGMHGRIRRPCSLSFRMVLSGFRTPAKHSSCRSGTICPQTFSVPLELEVLASSPCYLGGRLLVPPLPLTPGSPGKISRHRCYGGNVFPRSVKADSGGE